jgi:hypothetical protein
MDAPRPRDPDQPRSRPDEPHSPALAAARQLSDDQLVQILKERGFSAHPYRTTLGVTTYTYDAAPPTHRIEHDAEQRLFRITGPDGKTAAFRADPVRFLIAEADPQTGQPTPALKHGRPQFLILCREERER